MASEAHAKIAVTRTEGLVRGAMVDRCCDACEEEELVTKARRQVVEVSYS